MFAEFYGYTSNYTKNVCVSDFIKGLTRHNPQNFQQFATDDPVRNSQERASVYLPTEDVPSEQIIVLGCVPLTQQCHKNLIPQKREHAGENANNNNNNSTAATENNTSKKRPRLENGDN